MTGLLPRRFSGLTAALPLRVVVGGCAASINKTVQSPWRARENMQTAFQAEKTIKPRLWREGMHPFWC